MKDGNLFDSYISHVCTIQDYKGSIYRPQIVNEKPSKLITRINEKMNSNSSGIGISIVVGVVENECWELWTSTLIFYS